MADEDPEQRRVVELLLRERHGRLDEAEQVELALYREEQPGLVDAAQAQAAELARVDALGQGWLARVEADEALRKATKSPRARGERVGGFVLMGVGGVAGLAGSIAGPILIIAGLALVIGSLARGRGRPDPYDQIEQ